MLRILPNPSDGAFTFSLSSNIDENVRVVITNMLGEKVEEFLTHTNLETYVQLNVPAGLYLINASTGNRKWVVKLVINP